MIPLQVLNPYSHSLEFKFVFAKVPDGEASYSKYILICRLCQVKKKVIPMHGTYTTYIVKCDVLQISKIAFFCNKVAEAHPLII